VLTGPLFRYGAQAKCPALVNLPYDYEAYGSVARNVLGLI
jgi:hypothetical protein